MIIMITPRDGGQELLVCLFNHKDIEAQREYDLLKGYKLPLLNG